MTRRFEYLLSLNPDRPGLGEDGFTWQHPTPLDRQRLAELMLDAYRGTIDYDGETLTDALNEVNSYFAEMADARWLDASWLVFDHDQLLSASLVSYWAERKSPLIAYVLTAAQAKGRQLATAAVSRSLHTLAAMGQEQVRAVITDGNTPSEKLFTRAGFVRLLPD